MNVKNDFNIKWALRSLGAEAPLLRFASQIAARRWHLSTLGELGLRLQSYDILHVSTRVEA